MAPVWRSDVIPALLGVTARRRSLGGIPGAAEEMDAAAAVAGGTLQQVLVTLSYVPLDEIDAAASVIGGTLDQVLVTLSYVPLDELGAAAAITGGTLT